MHLKLNLKLQQSCAFTERDLAGTAILRADEYFLRMSISEEHICTPGYSENKPVHCPDRFLQEHSHL